MRCVVLGWLSGWRCLGWVIVSGDGRFRGKGIGGGISAIMGIWVEEGVLGKLSSFGHLGYLL